MSRFALSVWPQGRLQGRRTFGGCSVFAFQMPSGPCDTARTTLEREYGAGRRWRTAETLPVLDFRSLSDARLATAEVIFNEFRELDLLPAYLADADPNRALLDRRVIRDLLGFDEEVYRGVRRLAAKWCAEPSVHGGKARPKTARLVV